MTAEMIRAIAETAPVLERPVSTSSGWDDVDWSILEGGRRPAPNLPLKVLMPFWSTWVKDQAESKGAPADYVFGALLSTSASLIGNSRWVSPWEGWKEPPVLWVALIGTPSSGKSPAQDSTLDLLCALERELCADYPERLTRYATDREAAKASRVLWENDVKRAVEAGLPAPHRPPGAEDLAKPCLPRLHITDATQERVAELLSENPKGLLHHRDELTGWMLNFDRYGGGGDRPFWLEAFGGRRYVVDRVKHKDSPVAIEHLSISICGGIQPDRLASVMLSGDDDGLCSRFVYIWPEPILCCRPTRIPANESAWVALGRLSGLHMSVDECGKQKPIVISLEDDAAAEFQSWREENQRAETRYAGRILGHVGKYPGLVLRLALILEFLWWSAGSARNEPVAVSRDALIAAIALVEEYFRPMAERAFGDAALPEQEKNAVTLLKWLRALEDRPATINARTIHRKRLPRLRTADQVKSALKTAEDAGWVREVTRDANVPGRPRGDYLINPALYESEGHG